MKIAFLIFITLFLVQMGHGSELIAAVRSGQLSQVKALIAAGVDLNETDSYRNTALIAAVRSGQLDQVKALIAAGVDLNKTDRYGNTALHWAYLYREVEILIALLEAGADFKVKNQMRSVPADRTVITGIYHPHNEEDRRQERQAQQETLRMEEKGSQTLTEIGLAIEASSQDISYISRMRRVYRQQQLEQLSQSARDRVSELADRISQAMDAGIQVQQRKSCQQSVRDL